jgi:outer membrane protein assembly factor BamE (lipoprotein component of BamABCDE complex)
MKRSFAAAILLVFLSGCIFPNREVARQGQVYPRETLAFLDMKGTTRDEVISTLGTPFFESRNSRVLLYLSETAVHWTGFAMEPVLFPDGSNGPVGFKPERVSEDTNDRLQALLITYDERGFVKSHAMQKIGKRSLQGQPLEDLCMEYSYRNTKP